jgi:hypothetical protein
MPAGLAAYLDGHASVTLRYGSSAGFGRACHALAT